MTHHVSVEDVTADLFRQWGCDPYNLLQILIGVQQVSRHITSDAVDIIADKLSLPRANIEGVIGFYSFLHAQPRGLYDLLMSDNIVDQMLGSHELTGILAQRLGVEPGTTRADAVVSLGYTSCTGMGDQGPAALVNNRALTMLTVQRIEQIAALIETEYYGLYHATSDGDCTWFEFAAEIFHQSGLSPSLDPASTGDFGEKATRPAYSVLRNKALQDIGLDQMRPWQEALGVYLEARATTGSDTHQ